MIDLSQYLFKNVKIIDVNNETYTGFVDMYESSFDSGENEDSIGIIINRNSKKGIELYQSEIKSIEIA